MTALPYTTKIIGFLYIPESEKPVFRFVFFAQTQIFYRFNQKKAKVIMVKKGIFVYKGNVLEPPYIMRQEADRIFINDNIVYPFPEVEKPRKKPVFAAEPELPEFSVPGTIEETLSDFQKSWASGLVRDEKDRIKKAVGIERDTEDFIKDRDGMHIDADFFIQDYESQKEALEEVLKSESISFKETKKYHDVLVPVEKEWGVVALFNEAARIKATEEIDKEKPVPYKYPYTDAAKFKTYIETALKEGDMIVIDDDHMELIPHDIVDETAADISGFDSLSMKEKADELGGKLSLDLRRESRPPRPPAPPPPRRKSAVIFFPHLSWQREAVGRHSRYPFGLAYALRYKKYRVWMFWDTRVTLRNWARFLMTGHLLNLRAIYNQGHGNENAIFVGEPRLKSRWYYFNDQFVYQYARLKSTIVYIHSCLTLSTNKLAWAFLRKGACTYGGWKTLTSANPYYCDKCDGIFWRPLVTLNSTTGHACRALNTFDRHFECRGSNRCQLP